MRARALAAPVTRVAPRALANEVWRLADEFGWAKIYNANCVALARPERLGFVIGPTELD